MRRDTIRVLPVILVLVAGCGVDREPGLTSGQTDSILRVQQTLTNEQTMLSQGRDALEQDRRTWAERERSDPIIATSIHATGLLAACLLPLLLVLLLLWNGRRDDHQANESDTLLTEYLHQDAKSKNLGHQDVETARLPEPK